MHAKSRFSKSKLSALEAKIHRKKHKSSRPMSKMASLGWTVGVLLLGAALVIWYFRMDKGGEVSHWIQSFGGAGIGVAILLMALFCIIPVPSEFLMVMNMTVFGVWWGILYTWIGAMMGAVVVFFVARHLGSPLLGAFVSEQRLRQVEAWVRRRGALGLFMARLVPLPFIVVNYAAGAIRSIRVRDYIWTTGIGLLPYDLGAALVFLGVSKRFTIWLVIGAVAVVSVWLAGYLFNRRLNKAQRWAH